MANRMNEILDETQLGIASDHNTISALDFVSIGVGCFALSLIESAGILNKLLDNGHFEESELATQKTIKNIDAVKAALLSLCLCKVLVKKDDRYFLTQLGRDLSKRIGLVTMVFEGYGALMTKGSQIACGKINRPEKFLNGGAIALASIQFGEAVDSIAIEAIKKLRLKGTICDIGCGSAHRLLKICRELSMPGLGLDSSSEAIKIARNLTEKDSLINIEFGDATNLKGVWEDVQILMQSFMTHDIYPDEKFAKILRSYQNNFPNMKYFLVVDIVAPEDHLLSHMPAYDYVHGLLGIETRKYDRYTSLFNKSGYKIAKEIPIETLPNTFLWVLKPSF